MTMTWRILSWKKISKIYIAYSYYLSLAANVKNSITSEKSKGSQISRKYLKRLDYLTNNDFWYYWMAVLQENKLQPWRHFSRWLFLEIYPVIADSQGFKYVSFDPSKQVKVVFFSRKQNPYPHTPLSFSSKYVTL